MQTYPIARCANRGALCSNRQRKYLGYERPRDGSPSCAEGADVDPDEGYSDPARRCMLSPVMAEFSNDHSGDDHGHKHYKGSSYEHGFPANFVDNSHRGYRRDEEDNARYTSGKESSGTASQPKTPKHGRGVIDDLSDV